MKLAIIGASRGIGRKAVDEALERGHEVRALARSPIHLEADGLEVMEGDATNAVDMFNAIDGCDAVILTLGLPRDARVLRKTKLFSDATRILLEQMQKAGIKRLLTVTGFGAGDSVDKLSTPERLTQKAFLGRAYADKDLQEQLIRDSGLDWTIAPWHPIGQPQKRCLQGADRKGRMAKWSDLACGCGRFPCFCRRRARDDR